MVLSDAGRASVEASAARRRARWEGLLPLVSRTERSEHAAEMIGIGCVVWSATRRVGDDPIGGVILDEWRNLDSHTGELGERCFLVVNTTQGHTLYRRLVASEIDLEVTEPPSASAATRYLRAIWTDLGARKGLVDGRQAAKAVLANRLLDHLLGGGLRAVSDEWSAAAWQSLVGNS